MLIFSYINTNLLCLIKFKFLWAPGEQKSCAQCLIECEIRISQFTETTMHETHENIHPFHTKSSIARIKHFQYLSCLMANPQCFFFFFFFVREYYTNKSYKCVFLKKRQLWKCRRPWTCQAKNTERSTHSMHLQNAWNSLFEGKKNLSLLKEKDCASSNCCGVFQGGTDGPDTDKQEKKIYIKHFMQWNWKVEKFQIICIHRDRIMQLTLTKKTAVYIEEEKKKFKNGHDYQCTL